MSLTILDIETIPTTDQFKLVDIRTRAVNDAREKAGARCKKPESIKAKEQEFDADPKAKQEAMDRAEDRAGLSPLTGEIYCIAWASPEEATIHTLNREDVGGHLGEKSEVEMLNAFLEIICAPGSSSELLGFNIRGFDLPFLYWRAAILGCPWTGALRTMLGRYNRRVIDLQEDTFTYNGSPGSGGTLDRLCKDLGIEGKDGVAGDQVARMVKAGEGKKVVEYCAHDVQITRECAERMGVV